jgi:hypothetical protein
MEVICSSETSDLLIRAHGVLSQKKSFIVTVVKNIPEDSGLRSSMRRIVKILDEATAHQQ